MSESQQDGDYRDYVSIEALYDLALKKAGGYGYYQRLVTFIVVSGYALMGAVIYGLLFFLLWPRYKCLVEGTTDQYEKCDRSDICDGGHAVR